MKTIILAAGIGSRLGNPFPKPLTPLKNGTTIMQQQFDNISQYFPVDDIIIIVGFKKDLIMEAHPEASFVYNPDFDQTNTSKSLLRGLKKTGKEGVLWMNGDVVFDRKILEFAKPYIQNDQSFVCVNTSRVADEEVKYTVDQKGHIRELSKIVKNALGEAVGINYISSKDKNLLIEYLEKVNHNDYFERALELAIEEKGLQVLPVDISKFNCIEVDFKEDLDKVNNTL